MCPTLLHTPFIDDNDLCEWVHGGEGGGEGKEHGHKHKGHIAKLPSSLQRLIKAQCRTEHTVHETTAGKRDSLPLAMRG